MDTLAMWHRAAVTTVGLFWTAFWAFGLGYLVSSMIQVFVTRAGMRRTMGKSGPRSVALASFFGFISSSCSFAALATTRSLFSKGAGLVPSLAFLLASTNLVIELGIVIAMFLSWQFVVGEYVGGALLILVMWGLVKLTGSQRRVDAARAHARREQGDVDGEGDGEEGQGSVRERMKRADAWAEVANRYVMEWRMVWKDVTVGFTIAGIVATFVPKAFFETLFVGAGTSGAEPAFWQVLVQSLVGPVAAFFTFIGSMGNIPLAAVLFDNGVSFAGVMAFIFSDLVVFPVLRIQARYYGWSFALYVLGIFLVALVTTSILLHYGVAAAGLLPDASGARSVAEREFFAVDYTFVLNLVFLLLSVGCLAWKATRRGFMDPSSGLGDRVLRALAVLCFVWLAIGGIAPLFTEATWALSG